MVVGIVGTQKFISDTKTNQQCYGAPLFPKESGWPGPPKDELPGENAKFILQIFTRFFAFLCRKRHIQGDHWPRPRGNSARKSHGLRIHSMNRLPSARPVRLPRASSRTHSGDMALVFAPA